jgi:hypothetical protein
VLDQGVVDDVQTREARIELHDY